MNAPLLKSLSSTFARRRRLEQRGVHQSPCYLVSAVNRRCFAKTNCTARVAEVGHGPDLANGSEHALVRGQETETDAACVRSVKHPRAREIQTWPLIGHGHQAGAVVANGSDGDDMKEAGMACVALRLHSGGCEDRESASGASARSESVSACAHATARQCAMAGQPGSVADAKKADTSRA